MYDLTHELTDGLETYPGDPPVSLSPAATLADDGYRLTRLSCASHAGTHVDAPAHLLADGPTLGEYPIDRFVADAVLIDCRDIGAREPIPPERIPDTDADCLVVHTGWDAHWGTDRYLAHPYLPPETVERCVVEGYDVALDMLNPDPTPTAPGESSQLPAHHALLENDCLIYENVTGLEQLPERFELRASPLPIDADAAPVRAVGVEN